jgi:hypothetical protein
MQVPSSVEVGDRITAAEAAERHGLTQQTLCAAIDAGTMRAEVIPVGSRRIRLLDPDELAEDLASLPACRYHGCEKRALAPSGACSGPHARALETQGTELSAETRARMSRSQTKRHRRADARLRRLNAGGYLNLRQVASERHVAPHTVSRWVAEGFLRAECRLIVQERHLLVHRTELERFNAEQWLRLSQQTNQLPHWSAVSRRRWAGREHGAKGGRRRGYSDEQARLVREVKAKFPTLGREKIAELVSDATLQSLTPEQVRGILANPHQ